MAPPSVLLTPPNSDYLLAVIKQTGVNPNSGGGGGGGTGIPDNWGMWWYPDNSGTNQQAGAGPNMNAQQAFTFWRDGGTLATGLTSPGTGLYQSVKTQSFSIATDSSGNITYDQGTANPFAWASAGGVLAPTSGMIPLQGIVSGGPLALGKWSDASVAAGNNDALLQSWVNSWAQNGYKQVWFRVDWEFQMGTTYQLSASGISTRISAWQRMYNVMHTAAQQAGITIRLCWNPSCINFTNYPTSSAYPGDSACDVVTVDLYSTGGMLDNSSWRGYSQLTPGSTAQLSGGSPGTAYSSQLALFQSQDIGDAIWHFSDFPAGNASSPNFRSAVGPGGDSFGNESCWGMMDAIHFAALHKKPLGICECGYWSQGNNATTSGSPTWNVGTQTNAHRSDIWYAPYLKSRIAYAQSLGVQVLFISWFFVDPNVPLRFKNGDWDTGTVQNIRDTFGGTGVRLAGT